MTHFDDDGDEEGDHDDRSELKRKEARSTSKLVGLKESDASSHTRLKISMKIAFHWAVRFSGWRSSPVIAIVLLITSIHPLWGHTHMDRTVSQNERGGFRKGLDVLERNALEEDEDRGPEGVERPGR
jgi:hypothetical protein